MEHLVRKAKVTEKEFVISFSYADRDRAKLIRNYRWDPIEKVWRYPLSERTYRELLREFDSDELEFVGDVERLKEWTQTVKSNDDLDRLFASFSADDDNDDLAGSEEYRFICSLHQMVRRHGFFAKSNEELLQFLQECVLRRLSDAGSDTRLTIQTAQLTAALSELTRLRLERTSDGRSVEEVLVDAAWGSDGSPRPDFLTSFSFGSDVVIKATEWVARTLAAILRKEPAGAGSFYDLIREAGDAQILSKDGYRLCETLRHQRNRFGHDRVPRTEVVPNALLSLAAFSLIYRELHRQLPN